ncbi:MAG: hypothetical protein KGJ03_11850 [Betaproteobacteria bacterium]|nr:hypothetical protein [Betaproteobacteria bacterium]MBU6511816.1 hypothetical protein [Betaproteobacteria bacterium]MDE1956404.1 hypothetical protein [Betaproteobacteria bacterium]MDE2151491.1 hypothetical protein [Betaproteobacteria bacterium]
MTLPVFVPRSPRLVLRALPLMLAACLGACAVPQASPGAPAAPGNGAPRAGVSRPGGAPFAAAAASGSASGAASEIASEAGELSPGGVESGAASAPLGMPAIAQMLRQIAAMSQASANQRQQQLQALGARRRPEQRLELAYLLIARAAPTSEEAAQAHELLGGLDFLTEDRASRQFIRVLQRLSRQTVELSQARADLVKANRKAADLEDKIGQIKNLEVQLQNRSQEHAPKPPAPKGPAR